MTSTDPTSMPAPPEIPSRIGGLADLAANLWWTWQPGARELFRRLDYPLWRMTRQNAVAMLRRVEPEKLERASGDPLFLREYDAVMAAFEAVLEDRRSWYRDRFGNLAERPIAYFCAEFGLHSSIPIYSGGLGILAGDHCKEASDLGMPLLGLGLLYQRGYFKQRMAEDGRQIAVDEPFDPGSMPLERLNGTEDYAAHAVVQLGDRDVRLGLWRVRVGKSCIYLLDTDIEENHPDDRALSHELYGGGLEVRLRQEYVLGIGGVRALRRLGVEPAVWHANEGHAAFMTLERMREQVQAGASFEEAGRRTAASTVFTTHTPVPAGHDAFPHELMDRYFEHYWPELGLDRDAFLALGRHGDDPRFHMSALALRLADGRNAVSERHGEIARDMWRDLAAEREAAGSGPTAASAGEGGGATGSAGVAAGREGGASAEGDPRGAGDAEAPGDAEAAAPPFIEHVTNGVHLPTWVTAEFRELFDRYLGPDWVLRQDDPALWERAMDLPDHLVWAAHLRCKQRLFTRMNDRTRGRWIREELAASQVVASGTLLEPETLTLGFARRFATYKRATLLFRDVERLQKLLLDPWQPIQLVFAGKAHPADQPGQALLADVYRKASDSRFGGRIAFVEDYEINVARHLVSGVDVWLNTPRPPKEASGTSGQKAAVNGVLHMSTPDGWWAEGYTRLNGWQIGEEWAEGEEPDEEARDAADAESLYSLLEDEVRPLFYRRDADEVPRGWVRMMKHAIRTGGARFGARRMLKEYAERFYVPAAHAAVAAAEEGSPGIGVGEAAGAGEATG